MTPKCKIIEISANYLNLSLNIVKIVNAFVVFDDFLADVVRKKVNLEVALEVVELSVVVSVLI